MLSHEDDREQIEHNLRLDLAKASTILERIQQLMTDSATSGGSYVSIEALRQAFTDEVCPGCGGLGWISEDRGGCTRELIPCDCEQVR